MATSHTYLDTLGCVNTRTPSAQATKRLCTLGAEISLTSCVNHAAIVAEAQCHSGFLAAPSKRALWISRSNNSTKTV